MKPDVPLRPPGPWDGVLLAFRTVLGLAFLVAGGKLLIPVPFGLGDDLNAVAESFTDPQTGWIAPWLAERITDLGIPVSTFLLLQGIAEVTLAVILILGLATPRIGMVMAMMFVMFTMATPTGGAIRISADLALAMMALTLARMGGGYWSLDRFLLSGRLAVPRRALRLTGIEQAARGGGRDTSLLLVRLGMAYTLLASAVFTEGVFSNSVNSSLPVPVLLAVGALLAVGLAPRYVMGAVAVWLFALGLGSISDNGLLIGVEAAKREIALSVAAGAYALVGPDRWSLPRPRRPRCREVYDLLRDYVSGDLPEPRRRAVEFHIGDCADCWSFLDTYRRTVELGREMGEEEMPAEVYARLVDSVRDRTKPS
ncbi:anti-sigma factor [Nocardiopsis sp. FIRDI 009]|uniref:anti-sigma factor family protein n=1 Tax=Nocardiopsis sp. FIRDI 009 TaxID=714197 RepID=UPI000E25A06C|nr:zf-HC2 domain-containing protein [Nocardiopsis sp. FIRDI 009]